MDDLPPPPSKRERRQPPSFLSLLASNVIFPLQIGIHAALIYGVSLSPACLARRNPLRRDGITAGDQEYPPSWSTTSIFFLSS